MIFDLRSALPSLIPKAISWAEKCEANIALTGQALNDKDLNIARAVGVARPELIRIKLVNSMPMPSDPLLIQAAMATGLIRPNTNGMTLGHGIYISLDKYDIRLLSHECRHVYQYEQAGSIESFLPIYLQQVADYGYWDAPLEIDARSNELTYQSAL